MAGPVDDNKGNGQMMGPELTVFDNLTPDRRKSPSQAMFPPGYDLSMRPRTGSPRPRTASSRHSQSLQQAEAEFLEKLIGLLNITEEEAKLITKVISLKNRF